VDDFSFGSKDKNGKLEECTGAKVQAKILEEFKEVAKKNPIKTNKGDVIAGGYRIGSYDLTCAESTCELRRRKDSNEENHGMSELPKAYDVSGIDVDVAMFVLHVLSSAGQLKYIVDNAEEIYKAHRVVVDVDCQFDRRGQVGFHKDSRGTTAFVNLTFNNEDEMQGTDLYEDLQGDIGLEEKLPPEVQSDILLRREKAKLSGSNPVESYRLRRHGRISFSDPNRYHSTPEMGHRAKPTGTEKIGDIVNYLGSLSFVPVEIGVALSDLPNQPEEKLRKWYAIYLNKYNWHLFEKESSLLGEEYEKTKNVSKKERRISRDLTSEEEKGDSSYQDSLDTEKSEVRTFIRSWVRFVPN
jgi:hypothetical protein